MAFLAGAALRLGARAAMDATAERGALSEASEASKAIKPPDFERGVGSDVTGGSGEGGDGGEGKNQFLPKNEVKGPGDMIKNITKENEGGNKCKKENDDYEEEKPDKKKVKRDNTENGEDDENDNYEKELEERKTEVTKKAIQPADFERGGSDVCDESGEGKNQFLPKNEVKGPGDMIKNITKENEERKEDNGDNKEEIRVNSTKNVKNENNDNNGCKKYNEEKKKNTKEKIMDYAKEQIEDYTKNYVQQYPQNASNDMNQNITVKFNELMAKLFGLSDLEGSADAPNSSFNAPNNGSPYFPGFGKSESLAKGTGNSAERFHIEVVKGGVKGINKRRESVKKWLRNKEKYNSCIENVPDMKTGHTVSSSYNDRVPSVAPLVDPL